MKRTISLVAAVQTLVVVCGGAQREDVRLDVRGSALVESGYLSTSGYLVDTRPSAEQMLEETLWLGSYGRLTACEWVISALHGGRDVDHRRAFYLSEVTVGYGYDVTLSESVDFVNEVGIVWDSPIGYRNYSQEEVGWWFRQSVENPILVPYTETIGLFAPDRWLRVALGVRRDIRLGERLVLTPCIETVWGDVARYYACYEDTPSCRFLGGAFMTLTPGCKLTWRIDDSWTVWLRFREFITIDGQAREYVRRQSEYYMQTDASIFTAGVSFDF